LENIHIKGKLAVPEGKCTMCYRCINRCPKQAITLLGKEIVEQTTIEKYLKK
ncbi:MAG: 4Fe-4S binding protein, partial [Clostridiales bacterium]|nr:4Fe-4S binding protein [Clostridiales bacterium]